MAEMKWTREPLDYRIEPDRIEITTPYVGRCRKDQFRHLRLQSGEFQLQGHIHRNEDHRMCVESS